MTVTAAEELRANLWPICDSRLELSLPEPALIHGERRNATLVWCRAASEKHRSTKKQKAKSHSAMNYA